MDDTDLTPAERHIAGGDRRRRWFVACFIVAGLVCWALAARVYLMCGQVEGFCEPNDFEVFGTAGEPNPSPEQVADVARRTHERLVRACERHGRSLDELDDATDELAQLELKFAA